MKGGTNEKDAQKLVADTYVWSISIGNYWLWHCQKVCKSTCGGAKGNTKG